MGFINNFDEDAFKQMSQFLEDNWKFEFKKDMIKEDVSSALNGVLMDTRYKLETVRYRLVLEIVGYLSTLAVEKNVVSTVSEAVSDVYLDSSLDFAELLARYSVGYNPEQHPDGAIILETEGWEDVDLELVCALSKEFPCFQISRVEGDACKLLCRYEEIPRERVPASKLAVIDLCKEVKETYSKLVYNMWMNFISSLMFHRPESETESMEAMCHLHAYDKYGYVDIFITLISLYLMGADNSHTAQMDSMEQVQYFEELVGCYDGFKVSSVARPDGVFDVTLSVSPFTLEQMDKVFNESAESVTVLRTLVQKIISKERKNGGK